MATLTGDIDATTRLIPTDAGIGYYQVDDELIHLVAPVPPAVPFTDPPTGLMVAEGMGDGGPANPRKALGGTTAATHLSGATLTRYYPDAATGAGGGGVAVLEDPGEVWEASTLVAEGHRIKVTINAVERVFDVVAAGTTGTLPLADEEELNISPLGLTTDDESGVVEWRHLGIVGQLPFTVFPSPQDDEGHITFTSSFPPSESESLFVLQAGPAAAPVSVFEAKTDGDADWYLDVNAGAGFRFNTTEDGAPVAGSGVTQITTDGFMVAVGAQTFQVVYDYGGQMIIFLNGLPTADPGAGHENALWVDVAAGRVLKVSAG